MKHFHAEVGPAKGQIIEAVHDLADRLRGLFTNSQALTWTDHHDRARLPQRRFHDLRHSCANTYTKVVTALKRDAAKRIDDLINDLDA
jgi:hypothetical protein